MASSDVCEIVQYYPKYNIDWDSKTRNLSTVEIHMIGLSFVLGPSNKLGIVKTKGDKFSNSKGNIYINSQTRTYAHTYTHARTRDHSPTHMCMYVIFISLLSLFDA